jgi:hypothetical protein
LRTRLDGKTNPIRISHRINRVSKARAQSAVQSMAETKQVEKPEFILVQSYFILAEAVGVDHPDTVVCKDRLLHFLKASGRKGLVTPSEEHSCRHNPQHFHSFARKLRSTLTAELRLEVGENVPFEDILATLLSRRHTAKSPKNLMDDTSKTLERHANNIHGMRLSESCSVLPVCSNGKKEARGIAPHHPSRELRHSPTQDFFKVTKHHFLWPKSASAGNACLVSDPKNSKGVKKEVTQLLQSGNYFQAAEFTRQAVPFNFADRDLENLFRLSIRQLSRYPKWREFRISVDLQVGSSSVLAKAHNSMVCLVAGEPVKIWYEIRFKDQNAAGQTAGEKKDWIGIFKQARYGDII